MRTGSCSCLNGYEITPDSSDARVCTICRGTGVEDPSAWTQPFRLPISCPQCASVVHLINGTTNGLLSISIVGCRPCGRQWEITSRIAPFVVPQEERRSRRAA